MTSFMYSHTDTFFLAIFLGGFLIICYNAIEIVRYAIPHKKFFVQLEDLLYWVFALLFVFHIALSYTKGQIRFFFLFGIALGMVLCKAMLSPIILALSEKIVDGIKKIMRLFLEILMAPFRLLCIIFCPPIRYIYKFCEKSITNHLKNLKFYVIMLCRKNSTTRRLWRQVKLRTNLRKKE